MAQTIDQLYQSVLGRAPDAPGQQYWQQQFGETIDPQEEQAFKAAAIPEQNVNKLYQDVLGRAPEQAGMDYWRTQIGQTIDPGEQDKFIQAAFPEMGVAGLYKNILGREADEGGLKHWQEQFGDTLDQQELFSFRKNALTQELLPQNFNEDNVSKFFALPDIGIGDVNQFISSAKSNQNLTDQQKKFVSDLETKVSGLANTWGKYEGVDPYQAETIYSQIKNITNAAGGKNWSGDWMSGGDNATKEAAAKLAKLGVDNLADLKVTPKYTKYDAVELYNGSPVQADEGGKYYLTYNDFIGGNDKTYLPAEAQTQLAFPQLVGGGGESGGEYTQYTPLTADELKTYDPKTGKFEMLTGKNLIDGSTGKVISSAAGESNNFVIDYYDTGNFLKGKDKTFGIMFNDAGVPIPYTSTEKTGLVYTPILPLALGFLLPGIGNAISGAISGALPGAAVTGGAGAAGAAAGIGFVPATATNSLISGALGSGIMSGVTSELTGGDFGKGFLGGAFGSGVGSLVGGALPADWSSAVKSGIANTAGGVARTAVMGGDIGNALLSGAVGTGLNATLGSVAQQVGLTPQEMNVFSGIVAPLITKGSIGPSDILRLATQFKQGSSPYSQSQGATPYSQ
jgi:hypothetical protein